MKHAILGTGGLGRIGIVAHTAGLLPAQHVAVVQVHGSVLLESGRLEIAQQIQQAVKENPDTILVVAGDSDTVLVGEGTAQTFLNESVRPKMSDISFTIRNDLVDFPENYPVKKEKSYSKYQKGRDKRNK